VDLSHLRPGRAWKSGKECSREEVVAALQKLPASDEGRPCLTVIGTAAERSRVLADLKNAPALAAWQGKVRVQDYDPKDWQVKEGFVGSGKPTIYCQASTGKVLHRQDDYGDGAAGLATALRKADPNYDPARDPDLRKPVKPVDPVKPDPKQPDPVTPSAPLDLAKVPWWGWLLAVLGGMILVKNNNPKVK
jgi:hypothetical protein